MCIRDRHYHSGIYSSQLIANYQRIKDYNYSSDAGRYAAGTTLDDMEQRYIQWGNNVVVGHGDVYKRQRPRRRLRGG